MERRIVIRAIMTSDDSCRVEIECPDGEPEFSEWMTAAEFLLHLVATKSGAGFERAIELIADGAMTYRKDV
jgi:hypothetical protein